MGCPVLATFLPRKELDMKLEGAGAVVTGASRGLGRALAGALAAERSRVLLVARGEGAIAAAAQEIRERGGEAHIFVADVADQSSTHAIAAAAGAMIGRV